MVSGTDENGDDIQEVWLYVKWRTGGMRWSSETWIQNYLEIKDTEWSGRYLAMTCNAEYYRPDDEDGVTSTYVLNFYGTESFRVAEASSNLAQWHQIGQEAMVEMEWF